jgi:hypothetical protein
VAIRPFLIKFRIVEDGLVWKHPVEVALELLPVLLSAGKKQFFCKVGGSETATVKVKIQSK